MINSLSYHTTGQSSSVLLYIYNVSLKFAMNDHVIPVSMLILFMGLLVIHVHISVTYFIELPIH